MQAAIVTVIVILAQTTKRIQCTDESYVLSLTKDTFDDAVKNNKYLLVKFVAPWCGHCKSLTPAYEAAAKQLAESGSEIKLASVDATVEKELGAQFEVKGYPTLKFFSEGAPLEYTGGRSQDEIINWLKKKTGPPADELKTVNELDKFKESDEVVVIGAFKVIYFDLFLVFVSFNFVQDTDGDAAAAFLQVAKSIEGVPFGITSNKDVLKELNVEKDTIVLLKTVQKIYFSSFVSYFMYQFDEGRNDLTSSIDEASIREFIQTNQLPLVVEFNPQVRDKLI